MSDNQRTLKESISFSGKGLHSGMAINMTIQPSEVNSGIAFQRIDMEDQPIIKALAESVVDTSRSTTIGKGNAKISTIEHLMAAFYGCGIDNALVQLDAVEVPILEGSAQVFVDEILRVGTIEQDAPREYYAPKETVSYKIPEKGIEVTIYPDDNFSANINIDFNSKVVGMQFATISSQEDIIKELAPCRTFVFLHEILPLLDNNLIKGGDLDNAIVIVEHEIDVPQMEKIKKIVNQENLVIKPGAYLNNLQLKYSNEIARHKLLDLIGDLFLIGKRIKGRIFASKTGHFANTEFAKEVRKQIRKDSSKPQYKYDPNQEPVYDINAIKKILPHRPPFLLVDKITHISQDNIVGIKNVTMNEPFFVGHFPEEPVMPGVLIVEAMAQCGGVLALNTVEEPERYSTYFMKIDGVKFKRKVVPGDTLQFILNLSEPIRRGIVIMDAKAYVGDALAVEALLMAQIVINK